MSAEAFIEGTHRHGYLCIHKGYTMSAETFIGGTDRHGYLCIHEVHTMSAGTFIGGTDRHGHLCILVYMYVINEKQKTRTCEYKSTVQYYKTWYSTSIVTVPMPCVCSDLHQRYTQTQHTMSMWWKCAPYLLCPPSEVRTGMGTTGHVTWLCPPEGHRDILFNTCTERSIYYYK